MGNVCDVQSYALRELEEKYKDTIQLVYPKSCVRRMFHDFARCSLIDQFLETDCDILWFLDSDISPPAHVLDLVSKHGSKWEVAAAPYPVFMTTGGEKHPQVVFCVYNGTDGVGVSPADIPNEGTDWVDGAATGCLFIKREVFAKLKRPYFEFKYDETTRNITMGEDISFIKQLQANKIRTFIDYSMVCKHFKNVCLLEVNNYAITYAKKSVEAYDGMIRGQMMALAKSVAPKPKSTLILPGGA